MVEELGWLSIFPGDFHCGERAIEELFGQEYGIAIGSDFARFLAEAHDTGDAGFHAVADTLDGFLDFWGQGRFFDDGVDDEATSFAGERAFWVGCAVEESSETFQDGWGVGEGLFRSVRAHGFVLFEGGDEEGFLVVEGFVDRAFVQPGRFDDLAHGRRFVAALPKLVHRGLHSLIDLKLAWTRHHL